MRDSPCHGCALRHLGCHAHCPDYQAYTDEREAARARRALENVWNPEAYTHMLREKRKKGRNDDDK